MEIIHGEPIDLERVADLCAIGGKRRPPTPRDYSAFHVSNLLESARLITKGDNRYHEYEGHPAGIMSFGRIWESAVDAYLTDYATQKGGVYVPDMEHEQDGIIASLDGMMILPDFGTMIVETKLRFSMSDEIPLRHLQQMRAYCCLAGTTLACYVSGHLNTRPPIAQATLRIIRLTEGSIRETWEMLVKTKEYLIGCGCGPVVDRVPITKHAEKEQ